MFDGYGNFNSLGLTRSYLAVVEFDACMTEQNLRYQAVIGELGLVG